MNIKILKIFWEYLKVKLPTQQFTTVKYIRKLYDSYGISYCY